MLSGPHQGHLARMVMRLPFFFERRVIFIIHADQAGGAQRREDGGPGTDDDVGRTGLNAAPLACARGGE